MKKIFFRKLLFDCIIFFLVSLASATIIAWVFQAVNYLDIIIEDGRSHMVYLYYTILSIPKILSKILPFAIFFSFSYVLSKYELNNELLVIWTFGVHKMKLVNFFLKVSIFILLTQLIFTIILVPKSQEFARSIIKNSNVDYFENFIKPKKFIDTIKGLTIYADQKNHNNYLKNIYIKKVMKDNTQITFAKSGEFKNFGETKILVLYEGQTMSETNGNLTIFNFSKSDFNLDNLNTNTITSFKIQEMSSNELIYCLKEHLNKELKKIKNNSIIQKCNVRKINNTYKELYKRFIIPFYLPVLILISLFHIIESKEKINFNKFRIIIFLIGLSVIIFSETSLTFLSDILILNIFMIFIPILILFTLYTIMYFKFKINLKRQIA